MRFVVLGGGVIGVATAYYLLRDGHQVELVERREAAGLDTSWGNGAIIHISSVQPYAAPGMPLKVLHWLGKEDSPVLLRMRALPHLIGWGLAFLRNCTEARAKENSIANFQLALESVRAMGEIRAETGVTYDYAPARVIKTFGDAQSLKDAIVAHEMLAPYGLVTQVMSRAECVAQEPTLGPVAEKVEGGLFFPQDEIGDCSKFSQGLAAWCEARGMTSHYQTTIERVVVSGNKVTGVMTSKGLIEADAVVVALGSYTPFILKALGLNAPIYPVKGVSVTAPRHLWPDGPRNAILDDARKFALTPLGDRIRAVGSAEIDRYDANYSEVRIKALVDKVCDLFGGFRACAESKESIKWAGLRPMMPNGRPMIGKTPISGLFVNSGHGHTGWTMAAGSGQRLAQAVRLARQAPPAAA